MDFDINKNNYILVMDSGNGGKYTLNKIKKVLPNENYIYFEDDKNAPYGNKSKNKLKKLTYKNLDYLFNNYPIKAVVIACNTLSSICLPFLRDKYYHVPIFGVLPIIKKYTKPTLILCTTATKKYNANLKKCSKNKNIKIVDFSNLAKKIDENMQNLSNLQPFLDKKLKKYENMNICQVVLGCTHYNLIKQQIKKSLKSKTIKNQYKLISKKESKTRVYKLKNYEIKFIESSNIVAKNLKNALKVLSLLNNCKNCKTLFLKSSKI